MRPVPGLPDTRRARRSPAPPARPPLQLPGPCSGDAEIREHLRRIVRRAAEGSVGAPDAAVSLDAEVKGDAADGSTQPAGPNGRESLCRASV